VHFDGSFDRLIKDLKKFKVHWNKERPFKDI
jgi:hypothetical protein